MEATNQILNHLFAYCVPRAHIFRHREEHHTHNVLNVHLVHTVIQVLPNVYYARKGSSAQYKEQAFVICAEMERMLILLGQVFAPNAQEERITQIQVRHLSIIVQSVQQIQVPQVDKITVLDADQDYGATHDHNIVMDMVVVVVLEHIPMAHNIIHAHGANQVNIKW